MTQPTNKRLVTEQSYSYQQWQHASRVNEWNYPVIFAHRGGGNLYPEDTLEAFKGGSALGYSGLEAGDVQALSDGTLAVMHDSTVDRTTTGTGAVNTFTAATWANLVVDVGTQWGGSYVNKPASFWTDVVLQLAGKSIILPEVKDQLDATATTICDKLDAVGAVDSVIVQSVQITNLAIAAARGYRTMLISANFSGLSTRDFVKSQGVWSICIDYTSADFTAANIASWQAAGFRVFAYSVDHQADYQTVITTKGADGCFTNEHPAYLTGNTAGYRKTSTQWHRTGRWDPGTLGQGIGPMDTTHRGTLTGTVSGSYRLKPVFAGVIAGSVCPVANAAATYTVTVPVAIDSIPTTNTQGPAIYVAVGDDLLTQSGADLANCYMVKARANGQVQAWDITTGGASTSLGTVTATAFSNLTTTAQLTGGTSYTTISVSALTVALKIGHQFLLPSGDIATLSAAAIVGATSVTVNAVIPVSTVASGSTLVPYVTLVATVTPTNVTFSRGDESSVGSISAANTAHRGGYIGLSATSYTAPAVCSYHKVVVS